LGKENKKVIDTTNILPIWNPLQQFDEKSNSTNEIIREQDNEYKRM
jgi:hypothetical protein